MKQQSSLTISSKSQNCCTIPSRTFHFRSASFRCVRLLLSELANISTLSISQLCEMWSPLSFSFHLIVEQLFHRKYECYYYMCLLWDRSYVFSFACRNTNWLISSMLRCLLCTLARMCVCVCALLWFVHLVCLECGVWVFTWRRCECNASLFRVPWEFQCVSHWPERRSICPKMYGSIRTHHGCLLRISNFRSISIGSYTRGPWVCGNFAGTSDKESQSTLSFLFGKGDFSHGHGILSATMKKRLLCFFCRTQFSLFGHAIPLHTATIRNWRKWKDEIERVKCSHRPCPTGDVYKWINWI